ncbi:tripartite tricarboxylate transporter substrate binding protein [Ramlibacter sp. AW1]|uniref:Tripartite tricarboxylate transporter substrate binding protein n=1 Tax=Ramlibacter aurantiacus TaxID=2801330 RepID=A0A936ZF95_9BURK|nr:tripartite tricarboxylate transporter substrate binding protein [Ramlibacter aurantiacus]MBL0419203.1 tripartite tricarboxylate transporter substrate binding protein [Ramlibacter aurantiacus]
MQHESTPSVTRRTAAALLVAAFGALGASLAMAQDSYPQRPIRVIVPYAPGGLPDSVIRRVGPLMEKELGQTVVVDNKPGANGVVAAQSLLSAPNDGYTLIFSDSAFLNITPLIMKSLPYDVNKDFTPVAVAAKAPNFLAVNKDVPVKNLAEFTQLVRSKPNALSCGSSGVGTLHHLTLETMKRKLNLDVEHVPFRGSGQSVPAMIGGQTQCTVAALPSLAGHAAAGNARIIGVAASKPSPLAPEAAPMFPAADNMEYSFLLGFVGRPGMPAAVSNRISTALTNAMKDPEIVTALRRMGVEPTPGNAGAFTTALRADAEQLRAAAKLANLQAE